MVIGVPAIDHRSLREAMDAKGVTPVQLATMTGLSLGYVCDLRSGRRKLKRNPAQRRRIAEALGVPMHWIESSERAAA